MEALRSAVSDKEQSIFYIAINSIQQKKERSLGNKVPVSIIDMDQSRLLRKDL